jgi:FkbM family methyltransferase
MKEGEGCGQYGADRILGLFFRDQPQGFLVDVGAADGYWNSNSIGLLKRPEWSGILIEPEPKQFEKLLAMYEGREGVVCIPCAVGLDEGPHTLYCAGQVSTLQEDTRRAAKIKHGVSFTKTRVQVRTLTHLLEGANVKREIDFLSIDAEGMNYDVWESLDKKKFSPKLVCIEGSGHVMHGYKRFCTNGGNVFYLREDLCITL